MRASGIPDATGRAGRATGRVEAERMRLDGYLVEAVTPWEAASGGAAVRCGAARCVASLRHQGPAGWYDLHVRYFDRNNGASVFALSVSGQRIAEWTADDALPTSKIDAHSSTRHTVRGVALRPGDEIRIEGVAAGDEGAPLDYVEVVPSRQR
jgi:alpha-glucuronidase